MDDVPSKPVPREWAEAIAESEADLAAGRLVDGETVHREMRERIGRMEARKPRRTVGGH